MSRTMRHDDAEDHEEHARERRAVAHVQNGVILRVDERADHHAARPADERGFGKAAAHGDEHEQYAGEKPRDAQRKYNVEERPRRGCAEHTRGVDEIVRDALERGIKAQHHIRQILIHEHEHDGRRGVKDRLPGHRDAEIAEQRHKKSAGLEVIIMA